MSQPGQMRFEKNGKKKIPSTTTILQKASGLMMLQGTAQVGLVSPNKFKNSRYFG